MQNYPVGVPTAFASTLGILRAVCSERKTQRVKRGRVKEWLCRWLGLLNNFTIKSSHSTAHIQWFHLRIEQMTLTHFLCYMCIVPTLSVNLYRLLTLSFCPSSLALEILNGCVSYVNSIHLNRKDSFIYTASDHSFIQQVC